MNQQTFYPRKKTSLTESHAYNPIQGSRRNSWWDSLARRVSLRVSPRLSKRIIYITPGETLSEIRFFTRVIRLFLNNNWLRIDYALKEQHSLNRQKSFNNDQQTGSAMKNQESRVILKDSKCQQS